MKLLIVFCISLFSLQYCCEPPQKKRKREVSQKKYKSSTKVINSRLLPTTNLESLPSELIVALSTHYNSLEKCTDCLLNLRATSKQLKTYIDTNTNTILNKLDAHYRTTLPLAALYLGTPHAKEWFNDFLNQSQYKIVLEHALHCSFDQKQTKKMRHCATKLAELNIECFNTFQRKNRSIIKQTLTYLSSTIDCANPDGTPSNSFNPIVTDTERGGIRIFIDPSTEDILECVTTRESIRFNKFNKNGIKYESFGEDAIDISYSVIKNDDTSIDLSDEPFITLEPIAVLQQPDGKIITYEEINLTNNSHRIIRRFSPDGKKQEALFLLPEPDLEFSKYKNTVTLQLAKDNSLLLLGKEVPKNKFSILKFSLNDGKKTNDPIKLRIDLHYENFQSKITSSPNEKQLAITSLVTNQKHFHIIKLNIENNKLIQQNEFFIDRKEPPLAPL